jgi:hypothetical protein
MGAISGPTPWGPFTKSPLNPINDVNLLCSFGPNIVFVGNSRVTSSPPFCSAHSCWLPPVDGAESG